MDAQTEKIQKPKLALLKSTSGIDVIFPYDLRASLDEKCSGLTSRWTAYVNNSGTLCHVVSKTEQILVRVKFYQYSIKNQSIQNMRISIVARLNGWIKL